jgi:hypothetical protein
LRDLSVAGWWPLLLGIAIALGASLSAPDLGRALVGPALGLGLTLPLLALSLRHFTRSGPGLDAAQLAPHRRLIALSVLRLCLWCVAIFWVLSALGSLVLSGLALLLDWRPSAALHALAGLLGVLCLVGFRFVHTLLHNPGLLVASFSQMSLRPFRALRRCWSRLSWVMESSCCGVHTHCIRSVEGSNQFCKNFWGMGARGCS